MERGEAAGKPEKETGEKRAVPTKKLKMICGRLLRSGGICQQEDTRYRSEHVESTKHAAFTIVCPLCGQGPMDLHYAYRKRHRNACMVQHHLDLKIIAVQPEETWLRPAEWETYHSKVQEIVVDVEPANIDDLLN